MPRGRHRSVLAFSEADDIRYVRRFFDDAISLGGGDARETYLDVGKRDRRRAYERRGCTPSRLRFLSERAELAAACEERNHVRRAEGAFDRAMGSKAASRHLMQRLGVPVVPGYDGDDQIITTLSARRRRSAFRCW